MTSRGLLPEDLPEDIKEYLTRALERSAKWRLPNGENWKNSKSASINTTAVIGGGTMGRGIAIALCRAGYITTVVESDQKSLEICRQQLEATYAREEKLGRFSTADSQKLRNAIHLTTDLEALRDCDLVIESIFEKMDLKLDLLKKLSRMCKETTIFGTNTSSLDIDKLSSVLKDRKRLVGMHFFNPAHIIKTVEVVRGEHTSGETVATAFAVCSAMKKVPVLVGNCPSFVFNRLLLVYLNQAQKLLYQYGKLPQNVDALITSLGFPMGPLTMADMSGLDVVAFLKAEHKIPLNPIEKELMDKKRFGRKSGKGFYAYDVVTHKKNNDAEVESIVKQLSASVSCKIHLPCDQDVIDFILYPMVNEGFVRLEEGMIEEEGLIDIMFVLGFGWPAVQGGPMRWARNVGLMKIAERLAHWHNLEPQESAYKLSKALEASMGKDSQL